MAYTYDEADNMTSQTRYTLTGRVTDNFNDGDYTNNPTWTVESGTWSAATGALVPTPQSGARAIYTGNTYGNTDAWWSFKRTGTGGGLDNWMVQTRYADANNYLGVRGMWGMLILVERVNGVEQDLAYTTADFADLDVWYDVYVQMDGNSVVLYAGKRGEDLKRLKEVTTALGTTTNRLRVRVSGVMPWEFDDLRVMSRAVHGANSMTLTYGPANQLASITTSGVTSNFTYDAWGRLATRSAVIGGQIRTATYTYWFGDKLKRMDSDFPGETPQVQYNYDGLGRRRLKAVGNDTIYWRWDTGYTTLGQYQDQTPDWDITGFDRFFVPFGHTALAEATLDGTGNPANAVYTYLAQDHLGTSRHGFNHAKSEQIIYEHLPFGQRYYTSGPAPYHEFTGKPWDPDIQMHYFPFRYYSPNMNRWTTADPAGLIDGPNLYSYVSANSINKIDVLGLCETKCTRKYKITTIIHCSLLIYNTMKVVPYCTGCSTCLKACTACSIVNPWCSLCYTICPFSCIKCIYHTVQTIRYSYKCITRVKRILTGCQDV